MQAPRPPVEAIADKLLDALCDRTPPVDLHEALSFPLPVLVIYELLGVPYDDRAHESGRRGMADLHNRQRASEAMGSSLSATWAGW